MRSSVTALLFAALLAATGCGRQAATGVSIDRALKPLVPSDTNVLAGIDIGKLKSTPFYQRHQDFNSRQLDTIKKQIGLDPTRDISDALVAWNGRQALVLAHGSFNFNELEERLGVHRSFYKHHDLIGNDSEGVVLLKKGVAAAGSADALRTAIDLQDSAGGGIPAGLQQQLETLPKNDQIWVVSRGGLPFAGVPLRSDITSALSNIVGYISDAAAGVAIDSGTHWQAHITCVSDQGAQRVRDALRGGIGLARLTTKDNQLDQLQLYDSIHVDQDHQFVHIRADLTPDLMDKLISILTQLGTRARH